MICCYLASLLCGCGCLKARRGRWVAFLLALFLATSAAVLLHTQGVASPICRGSRVHEWYEQLTE